MSDDTDWRAVGAEALQRRDCGLAVLEHLSHQQLAPDEPVGHLVVVLQPAIRRAAGFRQGWRERCSPAGGSIPGFESNRVRREDDYATARRARTGPNACTGSPTRPAISLLPIDHWLLCWWSARTAPDGR